MFLPREPLVWCNGGEEGCVNTPWSSRLNRRNGAVGDRPGRARYRAGVMHSARSVLRGADKSEVVPHICPLSVHRTEVFCVSKKDVIV